MVFSRSVRYHIHHSEIGIEPGAKVPKMYSPKFKGCEIKKFEQSARSSVRGIALAKMDKT